MGSNTIIGMMGGQVAVPIRDHLGAVKARDNGMAVRVRVRVRDHLGAVKARDNGMAVRVRVRVRVLLAAARDNGMAVRVRGKVTVKAPQGDILQIKDRSSKEDPECLVQ
jgi:hypothetical protein